MRRVFPNYKARFEMATQVMGAMAEEIVKLRRENEFLKEKNAELEKEIERNAKVIEAQSQRVRKLHENAAAAVRELSTK